MKAAFQQKTLIHQNLCLVSRLADYKSQISSLRKELQDIKKIKGLTFSIKNERSSEFKINITHTTEQEDKQEPIEESNNKVIEDEVQKIKNENIMLRQRLTLLNDYDIGIFERVINNEEHLCYCGGLKISYYSNRLEQLIELQKNKTEEVIEVKEQEGMCLEGGQQHKEQHEEATSDKYKELIVQNKVLTLRLQKCQKKLQECKINHKFDIDHLFQTTAYQGLKCSCKNLLIFCSQLLTKQKNLKGQFEIISKEKQKTAIEMIKKFQIQQQKGKYLSLPERPSLQEKLQKEKEKYKQFYSYLCEIKANMRQIIGYYKTPSHVFQPIDEKTSSKINRPLPERFIRKMQAALSEWLEHSSFQQYCLRSHTNLEQLKKDWDSYIRKIESLMNDNEELRNQIYRQQRLLQKQESIRGIKKNLDDLFEQIKSLEYTMQNIREEIIDAQFRGSSNFNVQHFKYRRELIKRQDLERHISELNSKMPQCQQIVSEGIHITNLIETEKLQAKKQEGAYLGQIRSLRTEIKQKIKVISTLQDNIKRIAEEKNKSKIQTEKLRELLYGNGDKRQSENEVRLRMEIEGILKKITCSCGRTNEATVAMPCKHIFCKSCIQGMIKMRKRECPLCRAKFSQSNLTHFNYN